MTAQNIASGQGDNNATALIDDAQRENRSMLSLCSPSTILIGLLLFIPVGWLFWLSLLNTGGELTIANYERLFSPVYIKTFTTTFKISFFVTFLCIALGYPLAYMISQLPKKWAAFCMVFVLLPFWTSLLVRTYAWLVLLQKKGLINTWLVDLGIIDDPLRLVHNMTGTMIGMTQIMLPFLILPLYASMTAIDRDLMKAASNCGASPSKAFWQIFFPLSVPGLAAGVTLVFVLCLGFYVTPALLGGGKVQMWAMRIESNVALYANWGAASSLGVVLLFVTLAVLYLFSRLFRLDAMYGGK